MSRSIFKILITTLSVFYLACGDIPRDNGLDPKNPDSIASQKVMIEAFVNTHNPASVNEYALQALDSLSFLYGDRIVIAEYHRNTTNYTDPDHLDKCELLYQHYISQTQGIKGVPDIFINGLNQRVQGASSMEYSLFRLEAALAEEVSGNTYFQFDTRYKRTDNRIRPEIRLARLGTLDADPLLVKALIVSRVRAPHHKRVVKSVVESRLITHLAHGEQTDVNLPEMVIDPEFLNTLVVYVTDADATTIYQSDACEIQ